MPIEFSPWLKWPRKFMDKIERPKMAGSFCPKQAEARGVRLTDGLAISGEEKIHFYLLVDPTDGVIIDVAFQMFGPPYFLGIAETAAEYIIRKNYDQVGKLTVELLEHQIQSEKHQFILSEGENRCLNLIIDALDLAVESCRDIPLSDAYVPTPIRITEEGVEFPGWDLLTKPQQLAVIEEVVSTDIRPYIEMDAGGIDVLDIVSGREILIGYKGACTTCYSSVGSTLSAIQEILRAKVHPEIRVTPHSSLFHE